MTFEELCTAYDRLRADGYAFSFYAAGTYNHVTLRKEVVGSAKVEVDGTGKTLQEAFDKAISNFPLNPINGGQWVVPRL